MPLQIKQKKYNTVRLGSEEIQRLFVLSSKIADMTEDFLEKRGEYSKEFLSGLKRSLVQARQGKLRKISSLRDLR